MADISATSLPAATSADSIYSQPSVSRLSFASVAAMSPASRSHTPAAASKLVENRSPQPVGGATGKHDPSESLRKGTPLNVLQDSVAKLNLDAKLAAGPVIASADTELEQPQPLTNVLRNDDEKTHLSFVSNPTMSTDMRSIVSGTAFMDEKESIRPDESASVKGADESDSVSGQGSGELQSRGASETGKDGFRDQFQEVSSAKMALPLTANLVGRVPEDTTRNPIQATVELQPPGPDEKLLDALDNPKDRIFLLQLEQQVIAFIANTKEQVLSLPPQNSFCRLLAHRLGDYYSLSHTADATLGSVRLGKTEATRLPPSLKDVANPQTPESGVAQQQPALKIMRRNKAGAYGKDVAGDDMADGSTVQSQVGSDAGASGTDLQRSPSKSTKNMTREEREAHYQAARDRIFGDLEEVKPSTETSTAASRASSTTGGKPKKNNSNNNKNRPKNDDFEPRSSFMNMGYQQQQTNFGFNERPQQQMYGFPSPMGPGMPPHSMTGGYNDGLMVQQPSFQQQPMQAPHTQMQPQQMPMNGGMPGYAQPNYTQPAMYNGGYGFSGQPQPMAPMPMQQQYYPGPDQMAPYNNMVGGPMTHPNQQGYGPGYQSWNVGMPMQYGSQDQQGYFHQSTQPGPPGGMMFHNSQKPMEGTTPPARFNNGEYPLNMSPQQQQHSQQQQQQGQWQQWQGPPQYGQYPNMPGPWQSGQPPVQNSQMPPNAMMQNQKNTYQIQSVGQGQGKHHKKGNKGGKGVHSELGKYDTSSLPPKPPAPVQGE